MKRGISERLIRTNRSQQQQQLPSPSSSSKLRIKTDTSTLDGSLGNKNLKRRAKFEKMNESKLISTAEAQKLASIRNYPSKQNFYMDFKRQTSTRAMPKFQKSLLSLGESLQQVATRQPQFTKQAYERQDASTLAQWLEEMITQARYLNADLPFVQYYMDLAGIYSGAISEICRQVQQHSKEQAVLLQSVWDDNMNAILEYVKKTESHNHKYVISCFVIGGSVDLNSMKDISKVHGMYQSLLGKMREKQAEMKSFEAELNGEMSVIRRENMYLKRKELRREREINQLMKQYELVLEHNSELQREHARLAAFIRTSDNRGGRSTDEHTNSQVHEVLVSQAQKLLSRLREVDEKEVEEAEALRQLEVLDYYADVVFQDRGTDTGDLAPMVDAGTDTQEYDRSGQGDFGDW